MIATRNVHSAASAFGACCTILALVAFSTAAWSQAGYLYSVSGLVSIQREEGKVEAAKAGDKFDANTAYRTGGDGKLMLKFADGQVVALGADSALRVGQYHYDPASRSQNRSTIELTQGEMRFVSGLTGAANGESVRVIAGNSLISMSPGGADFTVGVKPGAQEAGYIAVARGEISARTPSGDIGKIAGGQYAPWQPGRTPARPIPLAAAPATIQASVAAQWATVLPASTPVEVASAARTAAAAVGPAMASLGPGPSPAGYVAQVSNTASIRTLSGAVVTPKVGTTFEAGASLHAGADGNLVVKFADGQIAALAPGATLAVNEYQFDPSNVKSSVSAIDIVDGAVRIVTGAIHAENHDGVKITAGGSTIDIVSSGPADFSTVVNAGAQEGGITRVTLGEISVKTPDGATDSIKTGQLSQWGSKTLASAATAATGSAVVDTVVALRLPDNTPAAIAPAARAAAAFAEANRAQAAANANPQNTQLRAAAQAAAELANLATQMATSASETGIAAKAIATMLQDLPPTGAGPALAQVAAAPAAPPAAPVIVAVTPGAGGGCTGSKC